MSTLDDHDFDELTAQARTLIPALLPEWTDHNPTDPGIVLVELLAWLTEMLLFELDQVPEQTTRAFLRLLDGPPATAGDSLPDAVAATLAGVRERYRAVTPDDYEHLARHDFPATEEAAALPALHTVRCLPGRDLTAASPEVPAPGHVSLVVLPESGDAPAALLDALHAFLEPRRLLTVRHHVVGPEYVPVTVAADLALYDDAPPQAALEDADARLAALLDPRAWPFGRDLFPSAVYAALESSPLIDYIENVRLPGPAPGPDGEVVLDDHQLVRLTGTELVAYDTYGRPHRRSPGGGTS